MVEGPGHDQLLVESENSATETELFPASLVRLWEEEDEGGMVDHHPQSRLDTGRDVTGVMAIITDDHLPWLDVGETFREREREKHSIKGKKKFFNLAYTSITSNKYGTQVTD